MVKEVAAHQTVTIRSQVAVPPREGKHRSSALTGRGHLHNLEKQECFLTIRKLSTPTFNDEKRLPWLQEKIPPISSAG
jgi:hypothetical protein